MLNRYGTASNPVLTGQSVHNQRIERLWRDCAQLYDHILQECILVSRINGNVRS